MKALRNSVLVVGLLGCLPAQQLRWQVPESGPSVAEYLWIGTFVDYDGDGYRDYLQYLAPNGIGLLHLRIVSGLDNRTLWQLDPPYGLDGAMAAHAGDMDGDGSPDLVLVLPFFLPSMTQVTVYSPRRELLLWGALRPWNTGFGHSVIGDIDTDGDEKPDVVASAFASAAGDVFVYDNSGGLRYSIPCLSLGRYPVSLAKMGDIDGDDCDDFVIGCIEPSTRGLQWLVSGKTGATIRETYGLLPGDHLALHVRNVGDITGDGVNDYAAFPWWSGQREIAVAYSGANGAVIRSWVDAPNSVVAGEDFDQDGVPDIVTGADWILGGNLYGRTLCWSGRDGSELWRVDPVPYPPGTGFNGTGGWMRCSANLGSHPKSPYPAMAWLNTDEFFVGVSHGITRAFDGARVGQGPVTGVACTSSGSLPLIGVRKLGAGAANTGFRTTVAKAHANALAVLIFAFAPMATAIDLLPLGFAGCTLYVDPAVTFLTATGSTGLDRGYAAIDLPHPLSAAGSGTDVFAQWLVLEPSTSAHAATQMHAIRLP